MTPLSYRVYKQTRIILHVLVFNFNHSGLFVFLRGNKCCCLQCKQKKELTSMSTFEFLHFHFVGQPFQKSNKGWKADVGKNIQHLCFNISKATIVYHIQQCVNTKYSLFMFCESSLCSTAGEDVSQSSPVIKQTEHPLLVLCVVDVVHCSV